MWSLTRSAAIMGAALLFAGPACAGERMEPCPPCLAFDRLDKQIRDGRLPKDEAQRQFAARIAELDAYLARPGTPAHDRDQDSLPKITPTGIPLAGFASARFCE